MSDRLPKKDSQPRASTASQTRVQEEIKKEPVHGISALEKRVKEPSMDAIMNWKDEENEVWNYRTSNTGLISQSIKNRLKFKMNRTIDHWATEKMDQYRNFSYSPDGKQAFYEFDPEEIKALEDQHARKAILRATIKEKKKRKPGSKPKPPVYQNFTSEYKDQYNRKKLNKLNKSAQLLRSKSTAARSTQQRDVSPTGSVSPTKQKVQAPEKDAESEEEPVPETKIQVNPVKKEVREEAIPSQEEQTPKKELVPRTKIQATPEKTRAEVVASPKPEQITEKEPAAELKSPAPIYARQRIKDLERYQDYIRRREERLARERGVVEPEIKVEEEKPKPYDLREVDFVTVYGHALSGRFPPKRLYKTVEEENEEMRKRRPLPQEKEDIPYQRIEKWQKAADEAVLKLYQDERALLESSGPFPIRIFEREAKPSENNTKGLYQATNDTEAKGLLSTSDGMRGSHRGIDIATKPGSLAATLKNKINHGIEQREIEILKVHEPERIHYHETRIPYQEIEFQQRPRQDRTLPEHHVTFDRRFV